MLCRSILYFSTIGVGSMDVYQHYWGTESGDPPPVSSTSAPHPRGCGGGGGAPVSSIAKGIITYFIQ